MEILKIMLHVTLQQNLIRIHLALCLPFQMQTCPSKHIAFCKKSSKSFIRNFYTEFRNSLPVLVQLLQSSLKGHELPQLSSFNIRLVPLLTYLLHGAESFLSS